MEDVDVRIHVYRAMAQGREVGWLVLRSAAFTPRESPGNSFYRRDPRIFLDPKDCVF